MSGVSEAADVTIAKHGDDVTITCAGALDFTNTSEFSRELRSAAVAADSVTVDLRGASFIDTAVLECLARAGKAMMDRRKTLGVVCAENSHPLRVLRISGFEQLLEIQIAAREKQA